MVQNLESPGLSRRVDSTGYIRGGGLGRGTWVFFGWVCAARDSKLAPHSKKNFPQN